MPEAQSVETVLANRAQRRHPDDDLLSMTEAARRLGVHVDSLYRWARAGHFPPAVRLGSRWVVSVPRLERYLHGESA